jgi:hypothetical protein
MYELKLWDSVWTGHRAERWKSEYCGTACGMGIEQSGGWVNTVGQRVEWA